MRVPDIAVLTDFQLDSLYAGPLAEREANRDGPPPETPDRPPTEDEYVALCRAMWGWTAEQSRAAYRQQIKG